MKKFVCLFLVLVCCLSGCDSLDPDDDNDIIWDFMCHSISMKVTDASGNDLFNAQTPGGPWEEGTYIIFNNEKFDLYLGNPEDKVQTRDIRPGFLELYLMKNKEGQYNLCFGEFSPTINYHRVPFTIYWGDGSKDQITSTSISPGRASANLPYIVMCISMVN